MPCASRREFYGLLGFLRTDTGAALRAVPNMVTELLITPSRVRSPTSPDTRPLHQLPPWGGDTYIHCEMGVLLKNYRIERRGKDSWYASHKMGFSRETEQFRLR